MTVSYKKSKGNGAGDYYLNCSDARTTELSKQHADYYTNDEKEPPGVWYCGMANGARETKLGFKHSEKFDYKNDSAQLFKNLVQGFDKKGNALTKNAGDANRVSLHDFTLSAPKSVSVAWAFADDQTKQKIAGAQQAASIKFLDFLSQYSCARTGKGGIEKVNAPLRAAMFEHASSRENDMQLHTHCVILNVAETEKKTTALQIFSMMKWQGAAASLYHADLAWRMKTMGFAVRQEGKLFEIDGIPLEVCEHFSKRRAQIKALVDKKMAAMGMDPSSIQASRGMLQVAALETRDQKNELTRSELQQLWNDAGAKLGFTQNEVAALLNTEPQPELSEADLLKEAREAVDELTQTHAVFKEPALLTAVAVKLMGKASTEQILRTVREVKRDLHSTFEIKEKKGAAENTRDLQEADEIFTTTEMMIIERHMLKLARRIDSKHILKDTDLPDTLQEEQRLAALWAMTDTNAVTVVEGTAGAGKTFTMAAVAAAYKRNGYQVIGLSNSWSAALNLKTEAALNDGRAITGWLAGVRSGKIALDTKTCVILDEAGMSGAREMREVLDECNKAGAKVILLGDTLQQKSVSCGDPLRVIAKQNGSRRLDEIRRQRSAAQRVAVHDFFAGRAALALQTYITSNDVHITINDEETDKKMIADWHAARQGGGTDLILAVTKKEVKELNRLAHEARKEAGELGESIELKSMDAAKDSLVEFSVGDRVVIRVSKAKDKIYNREQFTISAISGTKIVFAGADGRMEEIDTEDESWQYKDDGEAAGLGLQHAYATTAYASQGLTVDRAFVKDGLSLSRANAGVAMSRHRDSCKIYINKEQRYEAKMSQLGDDEWHPIEEYEDSECLQHVADRWSQESVKHSTLDFESWQKDGHEFDFEEQFELQQLQQAAAMAAQEISRISQSSKTQSQPKIKRLEPKPFQQKAGYVLPEPQENQTAAKAMIEKLAKNFIAPAIVKEAYRQGTVRFDGQGLPVFCGRRPDGKLVNPVTITAAAPGAMRDRFPPVLAGNPQSGIVHAVKKGIDALALWAIQDIKKIPRSTVVITNGQNSALGLPHIIKLIAAAKKFIRFDQRPGENEMVKLNLQAQKDAINNEYVEINALQMGLSEDDDEKESSNESYDERFHNRHVNNSNQYYEAENQVQYEQDR